MMIDSRVLRRRAELEVGKKMGGEAWDIWMSKESRREYEREEMEEERVEKERQEIKVR